MGQASGKFFDILIRWRLAVVICMLGLIAATAISIPKLQKDTSADAFIGEDQPALVYKNHIEEVFGLTDPIVIAVIDKDEDGIFDAENLSLVERLTASVESLPQIDPERVTSLATENYISGNAGGIVIEGFLDQDTEYFISPPGTDERAREVETAIADFPLYQGMLVGREGKATLIVAELLDDDFATDAYNSVLEIVANEAVPSGTEVHVAGEGAVMGYLSTYIDNDASRLNPMAGLIITVVLLVAFMSFRAAILPNLIVAGTVLGSFGLMAATQTSFFVITNGLVVNLIGIAVADSIHIVSAYYTVLRDEPELGKKQAIARAMALMWRPVTLTSVTTAAGFLALSFSSPMPPIQAFGLFGAIGVMLAWIYSVTFLPALLSLWPTRRIPFPFSRRRDGSLRTSLSERLMSGLGGVVLAVPKVIVGFSALLLLVGILGAARLQVEEERIANFKPSEPVYMADKAINSSTDGIYSLDVLVETPSPDGLYSPEILRRIERLQTYMETLPSVGGTTSIVDYVKQLHRSVQEGDPAAYSIPDDPLLVAQLFFLYGASADPADFEEEVDYDFQHTLVRAQISDGRYTTNRDIVPVLEKYVAENFNDDLAKATVTGRVTVSYYWFHGIDRSTIVSVLLSFTAVTLAAMLLFRSVVLGLLAALPVGFAILLVYSVMGWAGVPLGMGTSMFAAIAIGLSIDFAIHALDRIRELVRKGGLSAETLRSLYPETGRALLFNFLAVAGGFGVLTTSDVPPLVQFGSLVAVAVTTAFLASVTLLPALVLLLRPSALFNSNQREDSNAAHATSA